MMNTQKAPTIGTSLRCALRQSKEDAQLRRLAPRDSQSHLDDPGEHAGPGAPGARHHAGWGTRHRQGSQQATQAAAAASTERLGWEARVAQKGLLSPLKVKTFFKQQQQQLQHQATKATTAAAAAAAATTAAATTATATAGADTETEEKEEEKREGTETECSRPAEAEGGATSGWGRVLEN